MTATFVGVDIADDPDNRSRVDLGVNGKYLTVENSFRGYGPRLAPGQWAALDSPLGYPVAFLDLVNSLQTEGVEDSRQFKYRRTEILVGDKVAQLRLVQEANLRVPHFFNGGSHLKPTLGLQIVPGAIREVMRLSGVSGDRESVRRATLHSARLGESHVLEAHPRLFLYSALDRIRTGGGKPLPEDVLKAVKSYKAGVESRQKVLGFLERNSAHWLGNFALRLGSAEICRRDHDFDALLCALTAFTHAKAQTLTWGRFPGKLIGETVKIEGHMVILRTM